MSGGKSKLTTIRSYRERGKRFELSSSTMIPLNRSTIHSLLQALVVFLLVGATESFNAILKHGPRLNSPQSPSFLSSSKAVDCGLSECNESIREEDVLVKDPARRRGGRLLFQSMLIGALPWEFSPQLAHAEDGASKESTFVSGTVNLPAGITDPGPSTAIQPDPKC